MSWAKQGVFQTSGLPFGYNVSPGNGILNTLVMYYDNGQSLSLGAGCSFTQVSFKVTIKTGNPAQLGYVATSSPDYSITFQNISVPIIPRLLPILRPQRLISGSGSVPIPAGATKIDLWMQGGGGGGAGSAELGSGGGRWIWICICQRRYSCQRSNLDLIFSRKWRCRWRI